jgi:hypothetical protein
MHPSRITVELPDRSEAVIELPSPATPDLLHAVEQALARTLSHLRQGVSVDALDPGLVEYASWLPAGRR